MLVVCHTSTCNLWGTDSPASCWTWAFQAFNMSDTSKSIWTSVYMHGTPKLREHSNSEAEKRAAQKNMPEGPRASLLVEGKPSSAHLRQGRTPSPNFRSTPLHGWEVKCTQKSGLLFSKHLRRCWMPSFGWTWHISEIKIQVSFFLTVSAGFLSVGNFSSERPFS